MQMICALLLLTTAGLFGANPQPMPSMDFRRNEPLNEKATTDYFLRLQAIQQAFLAARLYGIKPALANRSFPDHNAKLDALTLVDNNAKDADIRLRHHVQRAIRFCEENLEQYGLLTGTLKDAKITTNRILTDSILNAKDRLSVAFWTTQAPGAINAARLREALSRWSEFDVWLEGEWARDARHLVEESPLLKPFQEQLLASSPVTGLEQDPLFAKSIHLGADRETPLALGPLTGGVRVRVPFTKDTWRVYIQLRASEPDHVQPLNVQLLAECGWVALEAFEGNRPLIKSAKGAEPGKPLLLSLGNPRECALVLSHLAIPVYGAKWSGAGVAVTAWEGPKNEEPSEPREIVLGNEREKTSEKTKPVSESPASVRYGEQERPASEANDTKPVEVDKDLARLLSTGNRITAHMTEPGKRISEVIVAIEIETGTGKITGTMEWPVFKTIKKVEGSASGRSVQLKETAFTKKPEKGAAYGGIEYKLTYDPIRRLLTGTWKSAEGQSGVITIFLNRRTRF